jgi:hypothetical protein
MSKDHEGDIKQYYTVENNPRRIDDLVAVVMFGFYAPNGGTSGEMGMEWQQWIESHAGHASRTSPRLVCYDDSWHALAQFKDVIDALAEVDNEDITPFEFCQILDRCGFTNRSGGAPQS